VNPDQSCGNCRFSSGTAGIIYCKRHPPIIIADEQDQKCLFPWLDSGDWCGEWKETFAAEEKAWQEHQAFTKSVHEKYENKSCQTPGV
jgi:hypothetical protein